MKPSSNFLAQPFSFTFSYCRPKARHFLIPLLRIVGKLGAESTLHITGTLKIAFEVPRTAKKFSYRFVEGIFNSHPKQPTIPSHGVEQTSTNGQH